MKKTSLTTKIILVACAILVVLGTSAVTAAQTPPSHPIPVQKGFETAQAAADALIQAAATFDISTLEMILGPENEDLIASGDPVQDKNRALAFAEKAKEHKSVVLSSNKAKSAVLSVGKEQWPLPIPIVKRGQKWYFDVARGRENILLRRIGANELDAITICRGYVDAQKQYAAQAHDGVNQYAQRVISTPGKQDGLYWENADGTPGGPISATVAKALQEGYAATAGTPYHGYRFKILKGQGPAAHLGKIDFVIQGAMIGGFAMVAEPAEYRVSGVKTFIVSHDGIVYQKDLGPDTGKIVQNMELYNPDKTWTPTQDGWPAGAAVASK